MVSLTDWDSNDIKLKILLKGDAGTGKTKLCAKIAGVIAKKGGHVLFLDGQKGAKFELRDLKKEIPKEAANRIELVDFSDYRGLQDAINKNIKAKGDNLKLIIIDPMKLVEIARLTARDIYIEQGTAPSGFGEKKITNPNAFDLTGSSYQLPTTMVMKFLNDICTNQQDIIATLQIKETEKETYKYKSEYDGEFDFVLECLVQQIGKYNVYKAKPIKRRGAKSTDVSLIDDPLLEIFNIFKEKYQSQIIDKPKAQIQIDHVFNTDLPKDDVQQTNTGQTEDVKEVVDDKL